MTVAGVELVGRQRELTALLDAFAAASAGRGRLVLVAGEPGIGKTRLVEELAGRAAAAGGTVARGQCWEGEGAPAFWPWIEIVRSLARSRAPTAAPDAAAAEIARAVPELGELVRRLPAPEHVEPGAGRFRLFDAFGSFLWSVAVEAPLALVLEDLHWADRPTLALTRFLVNELRGTRALIVGTYRDVETVDGHPNAAALADLARAGAQITLSGLDRDEVSALVRAVAGPGVGDEAAATVHEETRGNAFFVVEVARLLRAGSGGPPHRPRRFVVPESVRDVVKRRTEPLGDDVCDILRAASVLGGAVDARLVSAVSGRAQSEVAGALERAERARLVERSSDRAGSHAFTHALVREALYEAISPAERAELHRRAAEALEARGGGRALVPALAHHLIHALPLVGARKAAEAAVAAARDARDRLAYEDAAEHLARALDVRPDVEKADERRARLLLELGDMLVAAGDLPAARVRYGEAAELARALDLPEAFALAALGLGSGLSGFEVPVADEHQIDMLKDALAMLKPEASPLRAYLTARLSVAATYRRSLEERVRLAGEAIGMARETGDSGALAYALSAYCDAIAGPDHVAERLRAADEMIRIATRPADGETGSPALEQRRSGGAEVELLGRRFRIVALLEQGDLAAADAEIDAYARTATRLRQPISLWYVPLFRGMRALTRGLARDAEDLCDEARRVGARANSDNAVALTASLRLALRIQQGIATRDMEELLHDLRRAEAQYGGTLTFESALLILLTHHVLATGDAQPVREQLARLDRAFLERSPRDSEWLCSLLFIARAALCAGDHARAELVYALAGPYTDLCCVDGIGAAWFGPVALFAGEVASMLGRHDEARSLLARAREVAESAGAPLVVADVDLAAARAALARGDRREAAVLAERAAEAFEAMGFSVRARQACEVVGEPPVPPQTVNVFRREGDFWTVAYAGRTIRVRDSKGMRDIATLLGSPGREIHVTELVVPTAGGRHRPAEAPAGLESGAGPILDDRARAAYKTRLADLADEIDEAERFGDAERAAAARAEQQFIAEELSAAFGLGGRPRTAADPVERARKAVKERLRHTTGRLAKEHPTLARHLERSLRTGAFCSYQPETPVTWQVG